MLNIKKIKSLLLKVQNTRKIQQKNRLDNEIIVVSIVGYTNAGKSTLFNKLLNENVFSKNIIQEIHLEALVFIAKIKLQRNIISKRIAI